MLVAEAFGTAVAPGPLGPVNLVASAVGARGSDDQRAAVLPGLLDGSAIAAWSGHVPIDATVDGDAIVLNGRVAAVEAAAQAAHLLVVARTPGGLTHVLVPADTAGLSITPLTSLDLVRRYATVAFEGVSLPVAAAVGPVDGAADEVERLLQIACVLQCAETCGVIDRVFEITLEYLGDRYSFGRPLSSYQALKHRLADDKLWLEACHGTAPAAARAVAEGAPDARELVSVAKAVDRAARHRAHPGRACSSTAGSASPGSTTCTSTCVGPPSTGPCTAPPSGTPSASPPPCSGRRHELRRSPPADSGDGAGRRLPAAGPDLDGRAPVA